MIFFKNHFPIDGHLIYFQSFAIIKIAALYICLVYVKMYENY